MPQTETHEELEARVERIYHESRARSRPEHRQHLKDTSATMSNGVSVTKYDDRIVVTLPPVISDDGIFYDLLEALEQAGIYSE